MANSRRLREGYLVLADIAGYTAFLTGTELEHAQSIIEELVALIRTRLVPPLRFVKVEGDAVFCYADSSALADGERLIELLEVCYFAFSNLLFNMVRATTCRCAACAAIDSLDLKFIAHYGTYVTADGAGEDLAGPDVILLHRLLKNSITEGTGIRPYVYFTDACLERLPRSFSLPRHAETYEAFGETSGGVYDLAPVLREMREARREYVAAGEADHEVSVSIPHPPAVVWQYLVDPVQRLLWACVMLNKNPDVEQPNARGRHGVGAKSHCNHGPIEGHREIIDWRPFDYFTTRGRAQFRGHLLPARPLIETFELVPLGEGGTCLTWRSRLIRGGVVSRAVAAITSRLFRAAVRNAGAELEAAIEHDLARPPADAQAKLA